MHNINEIDYNDIHKIYLKILYLIPPVRFFIRNVYKRLF